MYVEATDCIFINIQRFVCGITHTRRGRTFSTEQMKAVGMIRLMQRE